MNFTRNPAFARSGILTLLLASFGAVQAQTDVIPSSVDLRLVQGATSGELMMQMQIHSSANFGGILSALTVTIRYDAASGASLGSGTSFCNAWSAFTPTPVVLNGGIAYRTYNGFGINRLEDPVFDGGCATSLVPEEWFTITTIPVSGDECTTFTLGNDAFTLQSNRDYYVSLGGHDVTGQVVGGSLNGGACTPDCLGTIGGTALPGTPCDDNDPGTSDDTWTADCDCIGTGCISPVITGTSNNGPICSSNELNLSVSATGSGPLTYAWTGPGTFSPDAASATVEVSGATTGSYAVTVSNSCGDASASIPVVVQQAPMAAITYDGQPYCTSGGTASVTWTGTSGGTYSSGPSGLSINANTGAIDLGASVVGTYTVSYTIAASGGCSTYTATASVVLNAAPSASIAYSGSPYCTSDGTASVTRTGTAGGAYSSGPSGLSINANTGAINLGNSTAGTYMVTYSIAASGGCAAFSTSVMVQINNPSTWYADADNDGAGNDASTMQACSQPAGYVAVGGDLCPTDPAKISPGACGCGIPDTDTDSDGTADCIDGCPTDPNKIAPGVCGCGIPDTDTDSDGTADCIDGCPNDPNKIAPGVCGCGIPDTDTDNDGTADCIDGCPNDPNKIAPGVCGCGIPDTDSDKDGIADCIDSCPELPGEEGDPCDDGDPATLNDVITADCTCAGIVSGMDDAGASSEAAMVLYPNPNGTGIVFLDLTGPSAAQGGIVIEVLDVLGRLVHREVRMPTGGELHVTMDLSAVMDRGSYTVQTTAGGRRFVAQLILQ